MVFEFFLYKSKIFWNQTIEFKWLISSIKDELFRRTEVWLMGETHFDRNYLPFGWTLDYYDPFSMRTRG